VLAGIDEWLIHASGSIRGIASRVQRDGTLWRTHTLRSRLWSGMETELQKRNRAIDDDWLYPTLSIHGYLTEDGETLLGFALVKTRDLMVLINKAIQNGQRPRPARDEDGKTNWFNWAYWYEFKHAGYWIDEYIPCQDNTQIVIPGPATMTEFETAEAAFDTYYSDPANIPMQ
ncbi:MAG: hypothetical protein QM346_12650, partial [Chloroflexota bacterium]|nr:hypothetical protein [Chloroflexota bacterium]